jgi:hypothetical protein
MAEVAKGLTAEVMEDITKLIKPLISTSNSGDLKENGWARLPNGLILQWGKTIFRGGDSRVPRSDGTGWDYLYPRWSSNIIYNQTFPIPFSSACFNVLMTTEGKFDVYSYGSEERISRYSFDEANYDFQTIDFGKDSFRYRIHQTVTYNTTAGSGIGGVDTALRAHFLAIGY